MGVNSFDCRAVSATTITLAAGTSTFFPILPIKGQIGLAIYCANGLTAGLEINGGGMSYAPAGYTLVAGVTTAFNLLNANGSSIGLVANGSGFPICRDSNTQIWPQQGYLPGAPALWLSAGASYTCKVMYFLNDAHLNQ